MKRSSLLPKPQQEEEKKKKKKKKKKAVNQDEYGGGRRTESEEREKRKTDGRGGGMMRFFPEIYVKLTTCNFHLKNSKAKPRLKWEHQLQERFLQSIHALGGEQYATPKKISYMMNAIGLTLSHLKSHLQKYRLSVRAPPRTSRINRKEKTNSVGHGGGSSRSTKLFEANKQNAESSQLRTGNDCMPLVIQEMEMATEVTSKTVAPASAREEGKEPAIQAMGNKMIMESSSFASSKEKESEIGTNSNGKESQIQNNTRSQFIAIGAASSSSFATGKKPPAVFNLETKSHPLLPNNICDIFQIGRSSFSKNPAYSNSNHQYSAPPPDSNSYFGKVGGSRGMPGNYQMNTSVQISSSLFHNTKDYETESGTSFSALSANSNSINNAISTFYPGAGIANSIGINSRFSGFLSMIENPMVSVNSSELGSNFPSISMMEQSWMGGFGWGIPSINADANPERLGSISNSFFPMVAMRPDGSSFSFPSVIAEPTELDSRFPMIISNPNPNPNPKGAGANFSNSRVMMVTPTEPSSENRMMRLLDSNFLSMLTNPIFEPAPTEFGSIFSSRIANANPNRMGPGSSSSLTLNENPMPQQSGSSFSSVIADNPIDLGIRFNYNFDDSVDSGAGTSLSLSYDNSMNTAFSSSSLLQNSMDLENCT